MTVSAPDLCMADPHEACSCGRCVLRSRLTNREVADIEVERDRALDQIQGAVDLIREARGYVADHVVAHPADELAARLFGRIDTAINATGWQPRETDAPKET